MVRPLVEGQHVHGLVVETVSGPRALLSTMLVDATGDAVVATAAGVPIAEGLGKVLGQPVVVENERGAGAIVGSETVIGQAADGHTLLMASNVIATGKWLYPVMNFESQREFRGVAGVFRSPHQVAVGANFKGKGIQDLIAAARRLTAT